MLWNWKPPSDRRSFTLINLIRINFKPVSVIWYWTTRLPSTFFFQAAFTSYYISLSKIDRSDNRRKYHIQISKVVPEGYNLTIALTQSIRLLLYGTGVKNICKIKMLVKLCLRKGWQQNRTDKLLFTNLFVYGAKLCIVKYEQYFYNILRLLVNILAYDF